MQWRGPYTVESHVVPAVSKDGATVAVAGAIHEDVDPELGEIPDRGLLPERLKGSVTSSWVLKDLVQRYPDVYQHAWRD